MTPSALFLAIITVWWHLAATFPSSNRYDNETTISMSPRTSQSQDQSKVIKDPCTRTPLKPQLWSGLQMNSYLDTYSLGATLNLQQYASHVGATDFVAGIGEHPNPGQLCESVKGKDWYALVAAQNWNAFVNDLYDSAGFAYIGLATTWVSSFPGCMWSAVAPIESAMFSSWGEIAWISMVGSMYVLASAAFVESVMLIGNGEDRFTRASVIGWMLATAQHGVQSTIANLTQAVIDAPISDRAGLAGINRDGGFLDEIPSNFQSRLQTELELALKLKALAKLWRVQDPCTQDGPNGAFSDPDRISYCGEDGIMMNIVRAEKYGDGLDLTIYHASLVEAKYGYSPEFLTTSAWKCQKTHGVFEYDVCLSNNHTLISLADIGKPSDCYFNLPVCDLTSPLLQEKRAKHTSLTKLCREVAGLPI
ncbi:uncharacterized protein MELLADRAFT_112303 [Melampsora larici-populina 98AG31]|uniref:DUF7872 domain-containing protein n=1 Tax=Melampsora larici-populina (strain 98AG31 / pathotype 3-4-7) TaxID=747676 RepID=F4S624_MELLP|nr:uncharacterized protein MELLADRAFT_112303 [Melampsora larici-populina 98AG31]EGF99916.1 hypothetical protein MELLADRAFT_112303 [Melampsora larici-populina 98AG31]